ncbi:hypothetical protein ACFQ0B_80470 [Nonomuraea thailandensis]
MRAASGRAGAAIERFLARCDLGERSMIGCPGYVAWLVQRGHGVTHLGGVVGGEAALSACRRQVRWRRAVPVSIGQALPRLS